jgi:hypothetical protein
MTALPRPGTTDGQYGEYEIVPDALAEVLATEQAQQIDEPLNQPPVEQMSPVIERETVIRERRTRKSYPRRIMTGVKLAGVALAVYGGYQVYQAITSSGGAHMEGEVTSEETRVTFYENSPIELAGIESDVSLELEAGYDRTVSVFGVEVDINPINNEYTVEEDLTLNTTAKMVIESMRVEEAEDQFIVSFDGSMDIDDASVDWEEEELAGADINWNSFSVGNEEKDNIDNDALEILQDSAGVTSACALRDENVGELLANGVEKFLTIVNPDFADSGKELVLRIEDIDSKTAELYAKAVDALNATIEKIRQDYSDPNDIFNLDISSILDCASQDIRITDAKSKSE